MESLIKDLILNASSYGVATYALATLLILGTLLYQEQLVLGKTHKKMVSRCEASDKLMADIREQSVEQRVINERSLARIENLEATLVEQAERLRTQELEIARLRGVVSRKEDVGP